MPTSYDDVEAQCPYFRYSQKKFIVCEGIVEGCVTKLEFKETMKRNQHRRLFCNSKYRNCEVHKMLEDKYEEV